MKAVGRIRKSRITVPALRVFAILLFIALKKGYRRARLRELGNFHTSALSIDDDAGRSDITVRCGETTRRIKF